LSTRSHLRALRDLLYVVAALCIAGAPARSAIPSAEKIADAVAETNRLSGRSAPLLLEVTLRIGDGEPVATGVLASHPTGLARLELAQALALEPRLLLLDSPLGRLPLEDRPGVAALIAGIRASGATVVLTEREPAVADAVADRVATLERGALIR